jgi:hypothetical protein
LEFANHHDQTHNVEDRYKSLIDWYLFKLYSILFSAIFSVGWVCVYMYCHWRSGYQEGMVVILLTHLTQQHYCACNNPGPVCRGPPLFVLSEWRWEAIDRFVDIGGVVDYHCLNFLFIIESSYHKMIVDSILILTIELY